MTPYFFAQAYGDGSYDESTYSGASTSTGTTGTGPTGTGTLADTGFAAIVAVTLACLIIFAALIIKFWKRPANGGVDRNVAEQATSTSRPTPPSA
jgi:hypothetical protein